tara:strand:+ start:2162 stop:2461 length:300 start_codon:yes stop_codon:yes gene_type:complete
MEKETQTQIEDLENQLKDLKDEALLISGKHEYAEQMYLAAIDKYEAEAYKAKVEIKDLKIKASLKASKHKERCEELEEAVRGYISYIDKYKEEIKELKE